MRHFKLLFGLAVAGCTLAVAATPAMAHEFTASREGATHGAAESEQVFKFGVFRLKCLKVSAKGSVVAGPTQTYTTSIKYGKCLTSAKIGGHEIFLPTKWLTPLVVEYHANGFVVTHGTAVLKINLGKSEEFEKSECHVYWPEQTIPKKAVNNPEEEFSAATFTNEIIPHLVSKVFPTGEQHIIKITNAFTGIKAEFEGEPCEEWGKEEGPESNGGTLTGSFPQILTGGNLEYL
jgi:hypothetical protein